MCSWTVFCFLPSLIFLMPEQPGPASASSEGSADVHLSDGTDLQCSGGKYFSHQLCLECPSGRYCPGNVSAPHRCPVGTFNLYTGKKSISACKPCFPGLISSEDGVDCRLCPAGFSCDPANGTLSLCPPGQHSPEGVLQCLTCPLGFICTSGSPEKCEPGKEPNVDHTVCTDCLPGFYSTFCSIQCLQCPAGSYCPDGGMSQPPPCPPGWSSAAGQTSCSRCNDSSSLCGGAVVPRWSQPVHRLSLMVTCRAGTYKDVREESACVVCPLGHYCVGGVAVPCPTGTYGHKEGLRRIRDCTVCPAGFYCLEGSPQRPTSQFLCPLGYYCEEGTATPHGSPCPAGTAGEQLGQTSRAACKRCREGRFCPAGSSGPGLPCARGRYCPAGLEEVLCPRGTFTPHQGAISVKDCLKCPAGFYCPEGTSDPVPCPPGSFNPLEGQDESADCRECYAGRACTQVALRTPDVDCMQGFVCPPGSSKPNALKNACPPGTLSDRTDLTDRSQCRRCPARYACLRGTGGIQRPPLSCFAGHYCPLGTMFPTQYKCPVGTWSGQSGLEAEHECQSCPPGWYCLAGSGIPSGRCSSGHYCPEGTAYGTQFPCPPGTYSVNMGNRHIENCRICPEGSFCKQGTSKPSPCPPSSFRRRKGGQRLGDCSVCPAGYFCPNSATVDPGVCGAGSYSDEGSMECSPCLPGHYCSNETTSEEAMLSVMVCPPGFLCSQGLARDPQRSAALCPRGFYCPGGGIDPNPIPCPNGTYSENPGLRDSSECVQCPGGSFCYSQQPQEQPITRPTGECPDGHYCPLGTGYPRTYPCQPGHYRNNTLGHGGEACVLCPSKHYCDSLGTLRPSFCPQGFYCKEGTSSPEPCPEGTYGSRPSLSNRSECSPCGGGRFCTGVGLSEPSGSCSERFYCREGATSATPVDGPTGGLCPAGSYCPLTSSSPLPCRQGTFSNSTGLSRPEECLSCPAGLYCSGSNITSPSGPCFPGFYCTGGSSSPVQHEAQEGFFTSAGASRPQPCPLGTFQPSRGAQSCVECHGGRLCNETGLTQSSLCPTGHFCPPGSSAARVCPPGSFSDQPGGEAAQHCRPCEAGWFCSRSGLSEPQGLCNPGHYCTTGASTASPVDSACGGVCPAGFVCPQGTTFSKQHPCPLGTWSSVVGALSLSSCLPCPPGVYCNNTGLSQPSGICNPGYYCSRGATSPMPSDGVTGDVCPAGHFCPRGSASPVVCPDGTNTNATAAEVCDECPPGTYCLSGEGVQPCPAGHYCLGGGVEGILPCSPGTYSPQLGLSQVEQCLICPAGFFCEDWGLFDPTGPCQAGYYCIAGVNFPNPDGNFSTGVGGACPKGSYCPEGTSLPLPCPSGTYSNRLHLSDPSGCSPCPAGLFCDRASLTHPSGPCQAGFYCAGGDTAATGSDGTFCPPAHYCPEGTASPVPCPAGTYTSLTGRSVCSLCPAGYYCADKTGNFTKFPCPPGFYCPDGTRHATQFPCPRGYYNPEPMTQSLDSCLPCPPGHYCEKERLTKASGKCKAGWFCVSAAWNSQPFDLDNYTNANCLCPATSTGGRCQVGFYCPLGSQEPLPCLPGAFCNVSGLALPAGPCSPGYYCAGGATEAGPVDGVTGDICPPGTFCVEGSEEPELCPAGTFSPIPGRTSEAGCQPCTAGFYCREGGLRTPSGPCSQGYWCPPGQTLAAALPCPPGHFCSEGSAAPEPCPPGTYQDREKQASCGPCEAGYYCHWKLANDSLLLPCPKGHYCPAGTAWPNQHPCPVGSFNPRQGAGSVSGCVPCAAGLFCPSVGLSQPAGPCRDGYWCREGASSPTPLDGISGSLCQPGQYCPSGTTAPLPCPKGSWSNTSGLRVQEDCTPCLGGFYCDSTGLTKPSGPCSRGYFCTGGAASPTPADGVTGGPCREGSYCPEGTVEPIPCRAGTYMAVTHAAQCEPCVPGWFCVSGSLFLCPAGFYCPEGTGFDLRGCPEGTYGPDPGYWTISQCRQCDSGHYCSSRNSTTVTGPCQGGYYCSPGNTSPQPLSEDAGGGGSCPVGHFCPPATAFPRPCPSGTFSNLTKLVSQEDCQPCLPGYYCDAAGLSAPAGECWEGFFCLDGAERPDPSLKDSRGGPCPKGYYCSGGSAAPQQCPMGTISTEDGRASCSACPQGFYCPGGHDGSPPRSHECPVGHYCPSGTWSKHQYPCPAGSINPHNRMPKLQGCLPCPPGSFCASPGQAVASGQCAAGFYCLSGARSPTPEDGGPTGGRCPEGHYCPQGSQTPLACPIGYYSNQTGRIRFSDCLQCPPGFLCVTRGLSFPSHVCPAGSYCPGSINSSLQASTSCSPGHMCPPGSHGQVPCSPGTYQDLPGQAECLECPAAYYCARSVDGDTGRVSGTQTPILCPEGHYCPSGTQSGGAFPCPAGTFSRQMGLSNKSGCDLCPPGKYCSSSGLTEPTGVCSPGYLCIQGSASAQPEEGPTGGRCSAGSYCPQGTSYRIPCPAGTFSTINGAASVHVCQSCLPSHYCAEAGLSSPSGPCSPGFYCTEGSRTPTPGGNTTGNTATLSTPPGNFSHHRSRGDVCPAGHYCPKGSPKPSACPPGTFLGRSAAESETDCEACYPGSYCPSWAQTTVNLLCPSGWFCPQGSASAHQPGRQCPPGHACPQGTAEPAVCSPGTFQSSSGQATCDTCPPGYFCTEGSSGPSPCPMGTLGQSTHRRSLSDCTPCPPGSFCNSTALTEPTGPCSPGHFCSLASPEPSPVSRPYGDVCPMGFFCPRGSGSPRPCPVGSFLPVPQASSPSQCHPCPPGEYCASPGGSQPTGAFCSGGADSPKPRASLSLFRCLCEILAAYTINSGVAFWMHNGPCFNNSSESGGDEVAATPRVDSDHAVTHPSPCLENPHYACSSYRGDICPKGFYCPSGSAFPQPCEAGSYCNQTGLHAPLGPCSPGYHCPKGSVDPHTTPCPGGHYCPTGVPLPLPCPPGTFKRSLGGFSVETCQPCPQGHFCRHSGAAEPSGPCAEGFFCPEGQRSERPHQHVCSMGHYCEKGGARQTACPPGSYQPRRGQGSCETCPAGVFCPDRGTTLPLPCERGFYCPRGSMNQQPCPAGTYGNMSALVEEGQCSLCDGGMYCKGAGRTSPTGPCAAGFVCVGGAAEPSPLDSLGGFPCPPGFFCSAGTSVPKPCPKGTFSGQSGLVDESQCRSCSPGFYCAETGLSEVSGPCLPGFYCIEGSQTAAPTSGSTGGICPVGHFCAEGCSVPSPCPAGSHQNETGGKSRDDCKPCPIGWFQELLGQRECNPCPPGFHCQSMGPSLTRPLPCPAGYSCPREGPDLLPLPCPKGTYSSSLGLASTGECLVCPVGHYCGSEGLVEPSGPCAAGFLCLMGATVANPTDNRTGSLCPPGIFCQRGIRAGDCLAGYYCNWGSSRAEEAPCPAGFFCPGGTPVLMPCPAGTFSSERGNPHRSNCSPCTAGYYCPDEGSVRPAVCPVGHYCPPGLTLGYEFPCPPGTVQNQPGASGAETCLPCPAGMFCSQPGLSQPTGLCEAGFYCPAGSSSPNSTEYQGNSTKTHLCPPGHYCPSGTGYPLPCPKGSLSASRGLKVAEECPPCPPGRFCDRPATSELSDARPCHTGFVCSGGSSSPTPSDGSHGYLCPEGHSCPVGSAREVPCEPGTYSPAPGAAQCVVCPEGTVCSYSATREPSVCPAGRFCPTGTALPQPCPMGTFSNQTGAHSVAVCSPCPSGMYCSSHGASAPQGFCLKGYFCQGGAMEPAPKSSDKFPGNGPCPVGHICPAGCLSPIPCPLGSIRNTTGGVSMESCSACPAGHYCSSEGLAIPSGPCAAGFYCPFDFSSTTPYAVLCPKGHYCPEGSALALPCPTGEYQPNPGSESCIPCRPGFYCEEAVVGDPSPCPPHSFCPAGTRVPQMCPNGTYTHSNHGGLQEERECLPCPPGKFCRAGRIQGLCAAGFLCVSGSADFTPQGPMLNLTQCQWGGECAGPCPPGFYCPEGTQEAELCPANTYRISPGGVGLQDCLPCPPQHWCKPGEPVLLRCPAGHYCDGLPGSDFSGGSGPRPCPLHTYRVSPGAGSKADCLPCPPGSLCNSTGLTDYSNSPCPPGFWCSGFGPPIFCPAGTKRRHPGAAAPSQCEPCAGGTFCPDPRATGTANVEGIPCRASFQCPMGAVAETRCRAGSYCGPQTAEPQICPEGYFCPEGSHTYHTSKQLCPFPFYCPANSSTIKACEGGSMPVNTSRLRGSNSSCCSVCEGGTYRLYLSLITQCLPCPPGYFCPPGTDSFKTNLCPLGHVCPTGASRPIPCPPGSFGNVTRAKTVGGCHPCPAGTFNHLHAQKACFPCGSSSTSLAGSSSCTCIGKNRAFQHSDGSCLCRTGFIFYNELDLQSSTSDSELDCQPEVNRRCAAGQIRLAASRECASPSLHSCNVTCGPRGGTLDVEMGICQCELYVSAEELCNTSCLSSLPQLSAHFSPDGHLLLSLKEKDVTIWAKAVADMLGPDNHARRIGKIHLVQFDSAGVFGWILTKRELVNQFLSEPPELFATRQRRETGEDDDADARLAVLPRVPNPVTCLSTGDMLIFLLTINHTDRRLSHFPVYQKDHLFNSNPSWDFGAFRHLEILMKQTNFNSTRFAHVFSETGKYVFADSAVPDWSVVVVVSEEGTECDPRTTVFQPMTPARLVKYGIIKQHKLNLLPDWELITGVLSLLLAVVVVVTTTVLVLGPSKAKLVSQWRTKPKWRSLGEPVCPVDCVCSGESITVPSLAGILGSRGVGEGAEAEEPAISHGGGLSAFRDLEDFNVKTLYDKLEDQNLHIASQLARHRRDTQEFYRNICQQAETLQNFLENLDSKKLSLLKELLVRNAPQDNPYNNAAGERDTQAEAWMSLLGTVLRSVEALLCRLTGELWQNQDLSGPPCCHAGHHQCAHPEDTNICYTQFSSMNMTKAELPPQESAEHLESTAPCLSDQDLSKMVSVTPLFQTLQEIQRSLRDLATAESRQHLHNDTEHSAQRGDEGRLVPTALDNLSPQHSAVYLFGCQMMRLLSKRPPFPTVLLLLAKSIPAPSSASNEALLAHCSRDFYFDAANEILYLSETMLQHVGRFTATILQSMAHIAAGSKPQRFMQTLHEAVSALGLQLFNFHFKWNKAELNSEETSDWLHGALVQDFLNISVPTEAQFTEPLLASRLEKYKFFTLEQLITNRRQSSTEKTDSGLPPKGTPMQVSCVEEEIDRMNESFLDLSLQLQKRAQISKLLQEREKSAGRDSLRATPASVPGLSRNGTILLELKRRYVSQRLDELQITLGRIRRSQERDGASKDGTGGPSGSDSSSTQQGGRELHPGTDDWQQDGIPASWSRSQQPKLVSPIPDQQGVTSDGQTSGSQDRLLLSVAGKQELPSEITIDDSTGQTDSDDLRRLHGSEMKSGAQTFRGSPAWSRCTFDRKGTSI